ncbi:MAG: hypothetical protein U5O39_13105 [Gammaproteobacteria bacterium]|nr:hypothetical protein [Gammaproteobacteria bacterium]
MQAEAGSDDESIKGNEMAGVTGTKDDSKDGEEGASGDQPADPNDDESEENAADDAYLGRIEPHPARLHFTH